MKRCVLLLAAALLPLSLPLSALHARAATFEDYGSEIPVVEEVEGVSRYSADTEWTVLTAAEAKEAANITADGEYIARATLAKANSGLTLDFSEQKIPVYTVESIDLRVRVPRGTGEIRISVDQSTRWVMRYTVELKYVGRFITISLGADGTNFWAADGYTMGDLANAAGDLGAFELMFYTTSPAADAYAYLDSATVNCRPPDTEAPVFGYDGGTDVVTSAERHYGTVFSVTAYDEYEQREVEVSYLFSEGAVDSAGILLEGEHTLTLRASDTSGNVRELVIALHVGGKDVTAPEIVFTGGDITTVRTIVGAYPDLRPQGRDNVDKVTVEIAWSEGALDGLGRLTAGEHTCTLVCRDGTGNQTVKTLQFIVTEEELPADRTDGANASAGGEDGCGGILAAASPLFLTLLFVPLLLLRRKRS